MRVLSRRPGAQPGHDQFGHPIRWGWANLATYLAAVSPVAREGGRCGSFREPQDLKAAIGRGPAGGPRPLELRAGTTTCPPRSRATPSAGIPAPSRSWAGPNFPLTVARAGIVDCANDAGDRRARARARTYEGERRVPERHAAAWWDVRGRRSRGCAEERGGRLPSGSTPGPARSWWATPVKRIEELDEIPSPYLAGAARPVLEQPGTSR